MSMKKTFGFTVAVMFAALVFGCSEQAFEEESGEQYDEQGRRLVTFSVPTQGYESVLSGGGVTHGP
jgi:hypothetical protein